MAKYKVHVTHEDGSEEEIEIPERVHRAVAGIARAEIERREQEREAEQEKSEDESDEESSWWSLGGGSDKEGGDE